MLQPDLVLRSSRPVALNAVACTHRSHLHWHVAAQGQVPTHMEQCYMLLHPGLAGSRSVADQCLHASLTLSCLRCRLWATKP